MNAPLHLTVWSDYLCPWCYNAAVRLHRLEDEFAGRVVLEWRSYLLRPMPDPTRTLEQFRAYTRSWLRPAADPDGGTFRVWATDAGPPSHSVPPHLVAKAAAALGKAAFDAIHRRLMHAYFAENRDITNADTLTAIWDEAGLPRAELALAGDPELLNAIIDQHNEAIRLGVNGVPAVLLDGNDVPITGALPLEAYRRWIVRALDARGVPS
ncbi:MAG TPA: DsbA family protein [Candidatus Limnocylindria bacterium]|nr:DsbA family protein [Candidatus Limnocylindria bacterium]